MNEFAKSIGVVDLEYGASSLSLARRLARGFVSLGVKPIVMICGDLAANGTRTSEDLEKYIGHLNGDTVMGYLENLREGTRELTIGKCPPIGPLALFLQKYFDLLLYSSGKDACSIEFTDDPPRALFIMDSSDEKGVSRLRQTAESLSEHPRLMRPYAFVLSGGDSLSGAAVSRRTHLKSWGDASDVQHIVQRIMDISSRTNANDSREGEGCDADAEKYLETIFDKIFTEVKNELGDRASGKDSSDESMKTSVACLARQRISLLENGALSNRDVEKIVGRIVDETLGYGPLEALLCDREISEVMVNGTNGVYVERNGEMIRSRVAFRNEEHILTIVERMIAKVNRRVDESSPMVDARLPDGSRVNAVIRPLAVDGPHLTVRRFIRKIRSIADLVNLGMLDAATAAFLSECVQKKISMVISGGTGSGKTTLLGLLASEIGPSERVITIEDAAELFIAAPHVVRLESRPPNLEGSNAVSIRDLVKNALRMRPDRIVVGECRGAEAIDMLQAMNTGHEGSMTSVHANSTRDALARLETMVLMAGMDLPLPAVREQISRAVKLVVQLKREEGGKRKLAEVAEVTGLEGQTFSTQTLIRYDHKSGSCVHTGFRPRFLDIDDNEL